MPITLPPVSRRQFLAGSFSAGIASILPADLLAAESPSDPDRFALLSDLHIAADPATKDRGVIMHDHLQEAIGEVLKLDPKPAAMFINGDCAHLTGGIDDYRTLLNLLHPVREADLPLHLTMGNHDWREHLWQTISGTETHVEPLPNKQVMVLEHPRADFFLLDSLDQTNHTPGVLGEEQLHWLATALDQRKDKPAIVMVHHNPDERDKPIGLTDTRPLLDLLIPRRQVTALFYGHTHVWEAITRSDLHCVNLPAVAYVFKEGQPSGWVDAHLQDHGISLELRCIDPTHPKHGEKLNLRWRE